MIARGEEKRRRRIRGRVLYSSRRWRIMCVEAWKEGIAVRGEPMQSIILRQL
jgi:hypothetical protein